MSRKRCHRRAVIPLPPRGLRPKLTRDQLQALGLAHIENLDAIATGQAGPDLLWDWAESALTWSRAAELACAGVPEMTDQLELVAHVIERYGRTGRVGFSGTEYQLAKHGLQVMDALAAEIDTVIAEQAAIWSTAKVSAWSREIEARRRTS
jgi:hypothetical protein